MAASSHGAIARSGSQRGSDDAPDELLCEQCQESGLSVVASTFCSNCNDFLCSKCAGQHKMLRGLKAHKLLEGADMPKLKPRDNGEEKCADHPDELIKLFCISHNVFGCALCITESHRVCKNVTSILKLSKDSRNSKELSELKMKMKQHKEALEHLVKCINEYHGLNSTWYDQSLEDFETFRREIEDALERIKDRVYAEADAHKQENKKKLESLKTTLKFLEQELEKEGSEIELKEKMQKLDQLFIVVKKKVKTIAEYGEKIGKLKEYIHIQKYKFKSVSTVKEALDEIVSTGTMKLFSGDVQCTREVNIIAPDDKNECSVSGIIEINPTMIVVADSGNQCLKTIDIDRKKVIAKQPLDSNPWDITSLPKSLIGVTLPTKKQIWVFSVHGLELQGSLPVRGYCLALESTDKLLVVSFRDPAEVQMLDFKGNVLKSFSSDTAGNQMFDRPGDLSLSPDYCHMYVCDDNKFKVTCLATDGNVKWVYEDQDVRSLGLGVATAEDGQLFVCSPDNDLVYILSPGGVRLREISLKQFNMKRPVNICYSKKRGTLYLDSWWNKLAQRNFIRQLTLQ